MTIRVGIDAWGLSGTLRYTGMGQYTDHLLRRLPASGAEVVAYGAPAEPRPAGLSEALVWRPGPDRPAGRWAALASRLSLAGAVERDGIDVFHCPGVHVRPSLPPVPRVRCPLVVTVHDLIPVTFYGRSLPSRNRAFVRWNLARALRADIVLTVSRASRDEIAAVFGAAGARAEVIPNVVSFQPRHDRGELGRLGIAGPFVLAAGSFEPRKNLRAVLSAFDRVAADHPDLLLVAVVDTGSGHEAAVRAALGALAHRDRVVLVASVDQPDLEVLYTEARAVVFCSLAEGFGLPAAQADVCGTPLVASDLPAIREVVGDRATFVDPGSVAAIASAIERTVRSGREAVASSRPARSRLAGSDPVAWADAHVARYRRLAERRAVVRD